MSDQTERALRAPAVPADVYSEDYYRHCCGGHEEWEPSGGAAMAGIYRYAVKRAPVNDGDVVVDVGTGRGELLVAAIQAGAARAFGVEYAPAALRLATQTASAHGVEDRVTLLLADARALPLEPASAHVVTMLDVVEHLAPPELHDALLEARRVLRPGGVLFVHTFPNRAIYEVTYRALRRLGRHWGWPVDPRNDYERLMHVNEQTPRSLRQALVAAGFRDVDVWLGDWVYTDFVPDERSKRWFERLARHRITKPVAIGNIFGLARP